LKVSTNVKIAMQCFENFEGSNAPPPVARLSGRMINYPVYDAHAKKANFTREQPMHPSSPNARVCNRTYALYFYDK